MTGIRQNRMSQSAFQEYLTRESWMANWSSTELPRQPEDWPAAVSWKMRLHAVAINLWYGVLANPVFWAEAAAYTAIMSAVGYTFGQHVFVFITATVLSYALAPELPLKRFTGTSYEVGLTNGWRLFIPFLLVGLSFGRLALGSSLVAMVAAGLASAGAHELFHPERGYLWKDRKFLTNTLERRLAVTGVSLPTNYSVVQRFVQVDAMDVDVKEEPKRT